MPIYEYECTKCGHYLEALQKIADKPLRECPECGRHSLKRLVSAPMFRLSGSGWYETDFKSDKETKRNLAEKGDKDAPAPESKSDAKAESPAAEAKTEAKPDAKPASESKPAARRTMVTKPSVKPAKTTARTRRASASAKTAARRGGR